MPGAVDYVALHAQLQPATIAAQELATGQTYTYRQLERLVSQIAASLRTRGVAGGDRVAALGKNRVELVGLHLACARLGAMYVPLNWRLSAPEIAAVAGDAEPRLVLVDEEFAALAPMGESLRDFSAEARAAEPAPVPGAALDWDAPSLILYTSGTSGRPKGVLLSERNLWQTALNFSVLGRVTHESAVLCDSPMFHIIGLVTNIRPVLMRGGRIAVSDGFIPSRTLERLADQELKISHYFCVPQMAAMMRADPLFDPDKLRHLTAIFSGGAPHAAEAIRSWTREGIRMADGFGMSEAGTVSCMPLDTAVIESHAGSVGVAPPGVQWRIVDERGRECEAGDAGELLVRGDGVSTGYWRRPAESREAFSDDGWFRSGDVARVDDEGFLWLLDRKKDMFISGGENVYPAEIEAALAAHPSILECAVIGTADARWGEVGHLLWVPRPGARLESADIVVYLESRLARYKIPKKVTAVESLPRNGAGKVLKNALRQRYRGPA